MLYLIINLYFVIVPLSVLVSNPEFETKNIIEYTFSDWICPEG